VVDDMGPVGTSWTLEAIENGAGADGTLGSVPAGVSSRLRSRDGGVLAVWPGCNQAGGDYSVDGDSVVLGELVATAVDCAQPVMEVESAVLDVLHGTRTFAIDRSQLRLTGGDRTLVYRTG
jgi:heat shock protein HslJ